MQMMQGPLTEERRQQLQDSAKEFMEEFGKTYLKMYGLAMFTRIKDDMAAVPDERKLMYRDWTSIERPDVFRGQCFMRSGEGCGSFGKWAKVYVVEMADYNLAVYSDQKSYESKSKPKTIINTAGYTVQDNAASYYRSEMAYLARGLSLTEEEANAMTAYSPYAWALAHPWRTNYMFQLHEGKGGGGCPCFGGSSVEPEDAGAEFDDQRQAYLQAFTRCTALGSPRDLDSITGKAFDFTVGKLTAKFPNLSSFKDEGLESQILVDMLLEECLLPMRDDILHDVSGPTSLKLTLWYKTRGVIQKLLQGISGPVWKVTQDTAQKLGERIEPQIRKGVEPILKIKEDVKQKIREKVIDKMGAFLQKTVTPFISPIFKAFDKPMTQGFEHAKTVFQQKIDVNGLPDDPKQRNLLLDDIPRTYHNTADLMKAADDIIKPIEELKNLSAEIFADVDPGALKSEAEMAMLQTLDAAIFTLETRITEEGKSPDHIGLILKDFEHDIIICRCDFVKSVVRGLLLMGFMKAIGPVVDPIIESLDGNIPEDVQDYISVAGTFQEIVDLFVGEPIDKVVEGAYPRK